MVLLKEKNKDNKNNKADDRDPEWVKPDPAFIKGLDERVIIKFYRFNKNQWKFWIGVIATVLVVVFVIK